MPPSAACRAPLIEDDTPVYAPGDRVLIEAEVRFMEGLKSTSVVWLKLPSFGGGWTYQAFEPERLKRIENRRGVIGLVTKP